MSLLPVFPAPIRFGGRLRFDQHEHENYKRALAGSTDDPFLKSFGAGVVDLARRAVEVSQHGF